jgi:hypothetical protein
VRAPLVVTAADTVFRPGDIRLFAEQFAASGGATALAARPDGGWAPLWGLPKVVTDILDDLPGPPFELLAAVERAGAEIRRIEIGITRDLTSPVDLVQENFSYLR